MRNKKVVDLQKNVIASKHNIPLWLNVLPPKRHPLPKQPSIHYLWTITADNTNAADGLQADYISAHATKKI